MVNPNNNGSTFFSTKITFLDGGEEKVVYTETPSLYEEMARNFKDRITNMKIVTVVPTEEQKARLEELNKAANGSNVEGYNNMISDFVEYGYINPIAAPDFLSKLASKYEATSKAYILSKFKAILSERKTAKEQGGCEFMGHNIKTDAESQGKITGTFMMMQTGAIPAVDFKTADGFVTLDVEQFKQLATTVATHVQVCFKAEAECLNALSAKTLIQLAELDTDDNNGEIDEKGKKTVLDLYEGTYKAIMKQLLGIKNTNAKTVKTKK